MFLDFVHRLFLKKIQRFGNWICFRPQIFRKNRRWRSPKTCCCVRMHPFMCSPARRALLLDFTFLVKLNGRSQRYLLPHTDGINRTCFILGNFFLIIQDDTMHAGSTKHIDGPWVEIFLISMSFRDGCNFGLHLLIITLPSGMLCHVVW
jgi:hypothetical protein